MAFTSKMIHRLTRTKTKDVAHSSGFARVQNGDAFGASSYQSFKRRQEIERNRSLVKKYQSARVAQGVNRRPQATPVTDSATGVGINRLQQKLTEGQTNRRAMAKRFEGGHAKSVPKTGGLRGR